jgi:hypothetical protein
MHYVLRETWPNSFLVSLVGIGGSLLAVFYASRDNAKGDQKTPRS